jgi:hypothetical protein
LFSVTGDSTTGTADDAGRRAGKPHRVQVRADDVESPLSEYETRPGGDVGRRRQDHRSLAPVEVPERRAVEQDLVVELGRELGPAPGGRVQLAPVGHVEGALDELALNVALQKALLVFVEQLVAVQARTPAQ